MPHSSGGGSHGGGSHGGGGHRGGSHGGSHSGGRRAARISRRPFANSTRYRYRRIGGGYGYIYADRVPEKISVGALIFQLIFLIPFFAVGIGFTYNTFSSGIFNKKPLTPQYSDNGNYIEDNIGIIDNEAYLNETLGDFQDLTGICPYIITVYDSDWENNYTSLENYAYDLYVNHFYDEQHFLIVYSEPSVYGDDGFVNWSWEAMQGDDTDLIITQDKFSDFQEDLQKYLTMNDYTVGQAFNQSFSNSLGYIMSRNDGSEIFILFSFFWDFVIIVFLISIIMSFIKGRRNYEKVSDNQSYNQGMSQNYNQNMSQSYNQGYNQNMNQDYNQNDNWYSGDNNPYSANTNRGYNLNGDNNGEL